jgi:biopolymer transport protein ExbD
MAMDLGAGGGKSKLGIATPEMNVTPLVDVVLVLLIIFMVITPLLSKQFWVHLPEERKEDHPPPPSNDGPIVVTVAEDGTIRVNRDEVSLEELDTKLRRALAAKGQRIAFFDAADDANFGRAAEVLDHMRGGGATTIAVLSERIAP